MRFRVYSTLYECEDCRKDFDKLVDRYPCLAGLDLTEEVVDKRLWSGDTKKVTVLTIKIDSINQLMTLIRDLDQSLIVADADMYGIPSIEIYDDYRE